MTVTMTVTTSTTGSISTTITADVTSAAKTIVVQEDIYKGSTLLGTTYRNIRFTSTYAGLLAYPVSNLPLLFSMRVLLPSYSGPLVKLRRVLDNATRDFYASSSGTLDVAAVNTWLAGSTACIDTWYNQGSGPNATAPSTGAQPVMNLSGKIGAVYNNNQKLTVPSNILSLTNAGAEGTVLMVATGANTNAFTFGVIDSSSNRWAASLNYGDGNCYFDGGGAVQTYRSFVNSTVAVLAQYTFKRNTYTQVLRKRGVTLTTGLHSGAQTTSTAFGIGYCSGFLGGAGHTGQISEFIMSNTAMSGTNITTAENDQISYWGV